MLPYNATIVKLPCHNDNNSAYQFSRYVVFMKLMPRILCLMITIATGYTIMSFLLCAKTVSRHLMITCPAIISTYGLSDIPCKNYIKVNQ